MCGILYYLAEQPLPESALQKLDKLNNRGPDSIRHVSYDDGRHAYFSRLAIIKAGGTNGSIQEWQDISAEQTGMQPLEEISSDNTIPSTLNYKPTKGGLQFK